MPQTQEDRETLESFIDRYGLTMECEQIHKRPDGLMSDMPRGSVHFRCVIRASDAGNRVLLVYFSQGPAVDGRPDLPTVLDCIASDVASVENTGGDVWEWLHELGYFARDASPEDMRRGHRAHKVITSQRDWLKETLGPEGFETLLWEVERR